MIYEVMYSVRDRETEYGDRFFVVAKSNDMAWFYTHVQLVNDFWENGIPTLKELRDGIELPDDYRIITLVCVTPIYYIHTKTGERIRLEVVDE